MATAIIQLPPDSTGKMIAARSYTESANTVYAQAGYLTTDTAAGNPAAVQVTDTVGTEYGLVTRPTLGQTLEQAGSGAALNAIVNASQDCRPYRWVSVHITALSVGGLLTFQGSNDNSNWVSVGLTAVAGGSSIATTGGTTGIWAGPINFRYFRTQLTSWTSGTTSTIAEFAQSPTETLYRPQLSGLVSSNDIFIDNNNFVDGTGTIFVQGGYFDEVAGTALTENDVAATRIDSKRAIINVIEDATTRGTRAAVSAAALAGTEAGLVTRSMVAGTPFTTQTPATMTASGNSSTATALGAAGNVTLVVNGTYGFTATPPTYIFEVSDDAGTTWYPATMVRENTGMGEQTGTLAVNDKQTWTFAFGGWNQIRMRLTAWGTPSGAIVTKWYPGGWLYEGSPAPTPGQKVQFQCIIANDTMTITDAVRTTLIPTRDYIAGSALATVPVTAGKKMRLTSWSMTVKAPSTTAVGGQYTLRVNPTGAAIVTSPAVAIIGVGLVGTQVAQTATSNSIAFPDGGIELFGIQQFTVSGIGVASAGYSLSIHGYEY